MEEKRDARGLTESEAIARYRSRNYPKPALTADIIVVHPDTEGTKVLLVERGGHPFIGKLALPGGFANENEPVEETAARELEEETGFSAAKWTHLTDLATTPGFCSEVISLYLAQDLTAGEVHPDEDEFLNVVKMPIAEVKNLIMRGEIADSKTIAAILMACNILGI